jgi:hypothetical protein
VFFCVVLSHVFIVESQMFRFLETALSALSLETAFVNSHAFAMRTASCVSICERCSTGAVRPASNNGRVGNSHPSNSSLVDNGGLVDSAFA